MINRKPEDLLDDLLDQLLLGELDLAALRASHQEGIGELQPHLGVAGWLQAQGRNLSPSPSFVRDTWRFMKLRLNHESKRPGLWSRIRDFWRRPFLQRVALPATIMAMFALIVVGPVVVSAAQEAIPGDRLYGVKLSIEKIQLVFAFSDEEEIRLLTEQATERLKEAQRAADTAQIEELEFALEAYQETTTKYLNLLGSADRQDIAPLTEALDQTAHEQVQLLETLNNSVENYDIDNQDQVRGALENSMEDASAFQDWLTGMDPTEIPPAMNTPTPTPNSSDENRVTPTPPYVPPSNTGTPSSWGGTPSPTSDNSIIDKPTPSRTPGYDGSKPPSVTPTPSNDQNPSSDYQNSTISSMNMSGDWNSVDSRR